MSFSTKKKVQMLLFTVVNVLSYTLTDGHVTYIERKKYIKYINLKGLKIPGSLQA